MIICAILMNSNIQFNSLKVYYCCFYNVVVCKQLENTIGVIQKKIQDHFSKELTEDWKYRWDQPDYHHQRPKLSRKDSVEFFTTLLDLYSNLVNGYEKMVIFKDYSKYSGCSLKQLFDCDGFLSMVPKSNQPFLKEFLNTQLFSNLITSRIEVSVTPSSASIDFPILFFDKYCTLMNQPFYHRFHHLEKVLYQRSNRILAVSIPIEETTYVFDHPNSSPEYDMLKSCILNTWNCLYSMEIQLKDMQTDNVSCLSYTAFCPNCYQHLSIKV